MNWKARVETKLGDLSDVIFDHSKKIIALVLLFVIALGSQLPSLKLDTSTEGFLHKTDPMRIAYDEFRDQFGRDERILIAIKTTNVFDLKFLQKLQQLHQELAQNLPLIDEVNSLINARNTQGTKDSLLVDDLFEDGIDLKTLALKKQLALANPLLKDLLFNEELTFTNIIIDTQTYSSLDENSNPLPVTEVDEFADEIPDENAQKLYLTDKENTKIIEAVQAITQKYQSDDFQIFLAGGALFSGLIKQNMKKDSKNFVMRMALVIMLILFLMFRRVSGVILPMVAVIATIVSAMSLMALFNAPFTVVTQIMPSFLLAVITGGAIHILAIFYKDFLKSKNVKTSLRHTIEHSGLAIIMTSLTTAAGMWSFSFSEVAPVADLGTFASASIVLSLLYLLILLPALLAIVPLKHKPKPIKNTKMDEVLSAIAEFATSHAKGIVYASVVIIITALILAVQLRFSHHPLIWFPQDHPVRVAIETVDKKLNGSMTLQIIVDSQKENGLYDPIILKKIQATNDFLNNLNDPIIYVGKTLAITDVLKETNKALNENSSKFYTIPDNQALVAQELLLFENSGSDDLEDFVDSQFSKARITVKVPFVDAIEYNKFLVKIQAHLDENFDNPPLMTGIGVLLASIMEKSIHSSANSYMIALVLISLMMILLMGSVKLGLISMLPNILPLMFLATIMFSFDMPLDMFTMLIGAIALGLAVDDTVHFMHNLKRYQQQGKDIDTAVRLTLLGTGRAIMVTSIVLSIGFLVLLGATMENMFNFGILTTSAIFVALIADFLLMPAIMKLLEKK